MEQLKSKVVRYLERAEPLFNGLRKTGGLGTGDSKRAERVLDTAMRYYSDAKHFHEKGRQADALAALEYAEGWMDAGKALGLLL